jgi:hypothetical protein
MDQDRAQLLLDIMAACALVVWLAGFATVLWAWRHEQVDAAKPDGPDYVYDPDLASAPNGPRIDGRAQVAGTPDDLAARACSVLARWMSPGALAIEERHNHRVVFTSTGLIPQWGLGACRRGVLDFRAISADRCQVDYTLILSPRRLLLGLAAGCVVAGLVALTVGYGLLSHYVAQSPNPATRYQILQMLQCVHFLWPPFLFVLIHRRTRQTAAAQIRGLVQNLPYLDEAHPLPQRFDTFRPPPPRTWPDP